MDQTKVMGRIRRKPGYKGGRCGGIIKPIGVAHREDRECGVGVPTDEISVDHLDPRYRRLMQEILSRAVLDLFSSIHSDRKSAERFFRYNNPVAEEFSFPWICEHLFMDPKEILKNIHKLQSEFIKYSPLARYRHRDVSARYVLDLGDSTG